MQVIQCRWITQAYDWLPTEMSDPFPMESKKEGKGAQRSKQKACSSNRLCINHAIKTEQHVLVVVVVVVVLLVVVCEFLLLVSLILARVRTCAIRLICALPGAETGPSAADAHPFMRILPPPSHPTLPPTPPPHHLLNHHLPPPPPAAGLGHTTGYPRSFVHSAPGMRPPE